MKDFLKIFITTAGLFLLIAPTFQSSDLYGFQFDSPSDPEMIEKDLEYLQNLNERADELLKSGEMDSIRHG